jgi:HEAT repeat protein
MGKEEESPDMDIEGNWRRIKTHRKRLTDSEIREIAEVLYRGQEAWLCGKLILREDLALAMEFLGHLGKSGSGYAVNILLNQMESRDEVIQVAAAESLKGCDPSLVFEPLVHMMTRQNQSSVKAGEVLLSYGEMGVIALWQLWYADDTTVRLKSQILQLLVETRDNRAESLAYLAFLSGEEELVRVALGAAERLEARELWGNVADCLKSPSWRIRGRAARLLGSWRENRARAYLLHMGTDPEQWVEEERQNALSLVGHNV